MNALGRIIRTDGQIRAARLEHAEKGDDEVQRLVHRHAHQGLGPDAFFPQKMGKLIGAGVQFTVGEALSLVTDGDSIRLARRHCHKEFVDRVLAAVGRGRVIPFGQDGVALLGREQIQGADGRVGVGNDGFHQGDEMPGHALNGGQLEKIGAVLHRNVHPRALLRQRIGDIKGGCARVQLQHPHVDVGNLLARSLHGRVLHDEHHLEQGRMAHVPFGLKLIHHHLEGQVLMGVGSQGPLPGLVQQIAEPQAGIEIRAQNQGVDEHADERLDLRLGAIGHRRAHRNGLLARIAIEQRFKRCQKRHEWRCALPLGQSLHLLHQVTGDAEGPGCAPRAEDRGPGVIGGEFEHGRQSVQRLLPVGKLFFQHLALEILPLPLGKIAVLDFQLGQGRGLAAGERIVKDRDLAHQHGHGPAVGDDVMQVKDDDGIFIIQTDDQNAEQGAGSQIEGAAGLFPGQAHRFFLPLVRRPIAQIHHRDVDAHFRVDHLIGLAIFGDEHCAQGLVPRHYLIERSLQHLHIQRAADADGCGDVVVGAPAIELIQEPEAALGVGSGEDVDVVGGGIDGLLEEVVGHG